MGPMVALLQSKNMATGIAESLHLGSASKEERMNTLRILQILLKLQRETPITHHLKQGLPNTNASQTTPAARDQVFKYMRL